MLNKKEALQELVSSGVSRREFARRTMAGGIAAAGALTLANMDVFAQSSLDVAVLNFALKERRVLRLWIARPRRSRPEFTSDPHIIEGRVHTVLTP